MPAADWHLTDTDTAGAAVVGRGAHSEAGAATCHLPAPLPGWGGRGVDLSIGGLPFRFSGLSEAQHDALARTYAAYLPSPHGFSTIALETVVERVEWDVLRAAMVPALAVHPLVLARSVDHLHIVGEQFGAMIPLGSGEPARLWLADETVLAARTVAENYLRVAAAYSALARGGLLLHSAGIVLEDGAHIFLGSSGAGKTTLARKADAAGFVVLSDDINMVMPADQGPCAFSLPFAGDLGATAGDPLVSHPVAALYRIEQGRELRLLPSSREDRLSCLLSSSAFVNSDGDRFGSLVEIADTMARAVPIRRLCSRREDPFDEIARLLKAGTC